jgi:sugar phosphate isomerase/epimerase
LTGNPLALQLYTVREQLTGDRKGVLAQVAAFGYGAVEPFDVLTDPDGLRAEMAAAGLAACSVHAQPSGERAAEVIRAVRTLGADTVIIPYLPPARFADRESVGAVARELNETARQVADQGLRLGYHNHDFELATMLGGRPALEVLAGDLDEAVLLEVDTYWAAVGGRVAAAAQRAASAESAVELEQAAGGQPVSGPPGQDVPGLSLGQDVPGLSPGQDVPGLLRRLGDRVRYLHVKDGPVVSRDDPMTAVGSGRMPVADILAACPSAEWHVVELDRCATDMMTAVGASIGWLASRGLAEPVQRQGGA